MRPAPSTDTLWIFKLDGTLQCESDSREIPLEVMRTQLETLIGADNVLEMEKRSLTMIRLCGVPTGRANAYRVTRKEWELLDDIGIMNNPGFAPWPGEQARATSGSAEGGAPSRIDELVGRPLRVYTSGDGITKDLRPERVDIEVSTEHRIVRVWFG